MPKIEKISESTMPINFNFWEQDFSRYWDSFLQSELGCIYKSIPWEKLIKAFKIGNKNKGRKPIFSPKGKIALMILKSYTSLSDSKLIDNLNANYEYQFFCDIRITPENKLDNDKIVSAIRVELASELDIDLLQKELVNKWLPYMQNTHCMLQDATCYESSVRYPTDVKLLWEAIEWIYNLLKSINKQRKGRMPRSKYKEQKIKQLSYNKRRRKTRKQTQRRKKSLLYLLEKLLEQLNQMLLESSVREQDITLPSDFTQRLHTIRKVLEQQKDLFEGKKVKNRIVSISKDYLRPIVRGKEQKRVEFGAKANVIQVDKIDFIEHISFDAFNEGTRFKSAVYMTQELFYNKLRVASADAIYGTNANRKFSTENEILTSFVPKGRPGKHESNLKQMRKVANKVRSTVMEGAFGKHKNHYNLNRINARTAKTELLWIFFGIHTANAVEIGRRIKAAEQQGIKVA